MDLRLALHQLIADHDLDAPRARRLRALVGMDSPPAALLSHVARGLAVLAAGLIGFGLILWLAANWDTLGRTGRFALLQGTVLVMGAGAWLRPAVRAPLGLLTLLGIGGLFAYFGQTYQTGADPWQLFALWAVLALPLCLGVRSDVVWAPWAVIVVTGIALWVQAHADHLWRVERSDLGLQFVAWALSLLMTALLSAPLRRWTGAGIWSWRLGLVMSVSAITLTALAALFGDGPRLLYGLGLLLLVGAAGWLSQPTRFDVFGLCVLVLGLNVLFDGGWVKVLFENVSHGVLGGLLLSGVFAAGLLAMSVQWVLKRGRDNGTMGASVTTVHFAESEGEAP